MNNQTNQTNQTNQNEKNNNGKLSEDAEFIDYILGQMRKIDSRIFAGQIILAFRETRRLIAFLENQRESINKDKASQSKDVAKDAPKDPQITKGE